MKKTLMPGKLLLLTAVMLAAGCAEPEAPPPAAETEDAAPPAAGEMLRATLTGAAEVPGPGDPDGSGTAVAELRPDQSQVCFEITVESIGEPTASHIHSGAADAAGPPVVNFDVPNNGLMGCVQADMQTIQAIQASPGDYYVNVHTMEFGPGAVRGQLTR